MAEASAAFGGGESSPDAESRRTVYAASGGRKFAFCFVFLLLLPFFVSLAPMLFWRVSQGHWHGTFGLVVLGAAFAFIMLLLLVELIHSLRSRVEIGATAVRMVPKIGAG